MSAAVINLAERLGSRLASNAAAIQLPVPDPNTGKLAGDLDEIATNLMFFAERFRGGKTLPPERAAVLLWRLSEMVGDCAGRARKQSRKLRNAKGKLKHGKP